MENYCKVSLRVSGNQFKLHVSFTAFVTISYTIITLLIYFIQTTVGVACLTTQRRHLPFRHCPPAPLPCVRFPAIHTAVVRRLYPSTNSLPQRYASIDFVCVVHLLATVRAHKTDRERPLGVRYPYAMHITTITSPSSLRRADKK